MKEKLLSWFWPEICPFCRKVNRGGICNTCRKKLNKLAVQEPRCMKCGKPVRTMEQEYCHDCMHTHHHYDRCISLWVHREPVNLSVYQFKYHNQRRFGILYAEEIVKTLGSTIRKWNPMLIMPIPLHKKRRRVRGYNQAQIIAEAVGKYLGIAADVKSLTRKKATLPQKSLGDKERRANIKGAFELSDSFQARRSVLLVDDIYTTGNTVDEAARVLKRRGVEKVYVLTISIGQGY